MATTKSNNSTNTLALYTIGETVKLKEDFTTRRGTLLPKGTKGQVDAIQQSRVNEYVFYYSLKFPNGTHEQGIEEHLLSSA